MPEPGFIILGDAIWVDFVNTARGTGPVVDRLSGPDAWRAWIALEKLPPDDTTRPFTEILELRERLTALAQALSRERQAPAASIHAINAVLAKAPGCHQLTRVRGTWRTLFAPVRPPTAFDAIARSAANTLSDPAAVVRQCSGPGCSLFLVDTSTSHSRRWCRMETCGKRMRIERRRSAR